LLAGNGQPARIAASDMRRAEASMNICPASDIRERDPEY
jgi:hypothetical protein